MLAWNPIWLDYRLRFDADKGFNIFISQFEKKRCLSYFKEIDSSTILNSEASGWIFWYLNTLNHFWSVSTTKFYIHYRFVKAILLSVLGVIQVFYTHFKHESYRFYVGTTFYRNIYIYAFVSDYKTYLSKFIFVYTYVHLLCMRKHVLFWRNPQITFCFPNAIDSLITNNIFMTHASPNLTITLPRFSNMKNETLFSLPNQQVDHKVTVQWLRHIMVSR